MVSVRARAAAAIGALSDGETGAQCAMRDAKILKMGVRFYSCPPQALKFLVVSVKDICTDFD